MHAFEMYWHASGIKSRYSGKVIVNSESFTVTPDTSYGYSDKNWGRDFTSPWVWLSSWDIKSTVTGKRLDNTVFDIGGGCPRVFGIPLKRKLLSAFCLEGEPYEFNFSKIFSFTRTKFDCEETDSEIIWHVAQRRIGAEYELEARCFKKDMLLVKYESPTGAMKHKRLWNGGNGTGSVKIYKRRFGSRELIDELEFASAGCEYGEFCD